MRTLSTVLLTLAVVAASGCLVNPGGRDYTPPPSPPPLEARTWLLAPEYRLVEATSPLAASTVRAYPTHNAYVNEDLEVWAADQAAGLHIQSASLFVRYAVDEATVTPFGDETDADTGTHFVFWLGSASVYPGIGIVTGDRRVDTDRVYEARIALSLPPGGLYIPADEPLELLVAPLLVNDEEGVNLHYLVGGTDSPSRIDLVARSWNGTQPNWEHIESSSHELEGNGGLFTGLLQGFSDTYEMPVTIPVDAEAWRVDLVHESSLGTKGDLDMVLLRRGTEEVWAIGTTPYQSETIRALDDGLGLLQGREWTLRVTAYSGLQNEFTLRFSWT